MCAVISVQGSELVSPMMREMPDCPLVRSAALLLYWEGSFTVDTLGIVPFFLLCPDFVFCIGQLSADLRSYNWLCNCFITFR